MLFVRQEKLRLGANRKDGYKLAIKKLVEQNSYNALLKKQQKFSEVPISTRNRSKPKKDKFVGDQGEEDPQPVREKPQVFTKRT